MNFKKNILICCFSLVYATAFSQKTAIYTHELKNYNHAIELYKDNSYLASQQLFNQIRGGFDNTTELRANCVYYIANCAIRLNQRGADDLMLVTVAAIITPNTRDIYQDRDDRCATIYDLTG